MFKVGNLLCRCRPWLATGYPGFGDAYVIVLEIATNTSAVNRAKILAPEGIFVVELAWLAEHYKAAS